MRLPNALSEMRKLSPLTALLDPKTFWKNKEAATCVEFLSSVLETEYWTISRNLQQFLIFQICNPLRGGQNYLRQSRRYLPVDKEWPR